MKLIREARQMWQDMQGESHYPGLYRFAMIGCLAFGLVLIIMAFNQ